MIGQSSRHCGCPRQGRMRMTEVVHTAGPEQRRFQLVACARWRSRPSHQGWHPRAQGRIQSLDIRRIDPAQLDLRLLHQHFGPRQTPMRQPARDAEEPPADPALYHLHDVQILPHNQRRTSALAGRLSLAKDLQDHAHVCREAIDGEQDWAVWLCSRSNLRDDRLDQRGITVPTDRAPEPPARKDTHRGRNPDRPSLGFGVQLIGLDLAEIDLTITDQLLLHLAGMPASLGLPIGDGTLIETKGKHDGWDGTTATQQRQHDAHEPERMLETEQRCAAGLGKGFVTGMADEAAFFV